jgi:protein O-GlcNAc transferase
VRDGKIASDPFPLLALSSTPGDQLQCAKRDAADHPTFAKLWRGEVYSHERIRIGYVSANLHEHPVAYLAAGLFERHDRSRFEVTAISLGPDRDSDLRRRLKAAFEHFIDAGSQSDQEIAELIQRREIDIVVDLNGFTSGCRPGIFARRPAPIQVNYLGYAGTMGADGFDYILADRTVIPDGQFEFYSEKVAWLPDCFMVNDDRRLISGATPTRSECGLPETAFVFCCFNNAYKIAPETFDVWMRLLAAVDDSVIWLSELNPTAMANLRREAENRGVSQERLIFAARAPAMEDHLARQRQADLFLDTLPYNAHSTASDALWAGLPVLTCLGATFAGRVAGSLLNAIGLPELVTSSLDKYEALAIKLARDPALLASIKTKLATNRDTHPLFNSARFTRHIEAAYTTMVERSRRRQPPESFAVEVIE